MGKQKLHRKVKDGQGWRRVVKRGEMKYTEFSILRLVRGQEQELGGPKRETVIVLTSGGCNAWIDDEKKAIRMDRRNVFDDMPWALYLPNGRSTRIKARKATELIVAQAPAKRKTLAVRVFSPADIEPITRGTANFAREIRSIVVSTDETEHLTFGETINGPGNWSSYPPHKHDSYDPPNEYPLEEIYFYKLQPSQGFGLQRVYTKGRKFDEIYLIENNDVVMLKKGYHPVVAAGGYKLYYFWIIASKTARLCFVDDPAHAWVKDMKW